MNSSNEEFNDMLIQSPWYPKRKVLRIWKKCIVHGHHDLSNKIYKKYRNCFPYSPLLSGQFMEMIGIPYCDFGCTNFSFEDAVEHLKDGKTLRHKYFGPDEFIRLNKSGDVECENKHLTESYGRWYSRMSNSINMFRSPYWRIIK